MRASIQRQNNKASATTSRAHDLCIVLWKLLLCKFCFKNTLLLVLLYFKTCNFNGYYLNIWLMSKYLNNNLFREIFRLTVSAFGNQSQICVWTSWCEVYWYGCNYSRVGYYTANIKLGSFDRCTKRLILLSINVIILLDGNHFVFWNLILKF